MNTKIHYIMPMAGCGSRFKNMGYDVPKPLIEIYGKPFFYWSTISIKKFVQLKSLTFVVLKEHIENFSIDKEIHKYFKDANIIALPDVTEGAVITSMKGVEEINDDLPLVFNDCDHLFKSTSFNNFINNEFDTNISGALLTFEANEPKYSFIKKDSNENVIQTAEKVVISNEAICGCYYFRNKNIFLESSNKYLTKCNYNEYFTSGVYNVMIENNLLIKSFKTDFHVPFGVPSEYQEAEKSNEYLELGE